MKTAMRDAIELGINILSSAHKPASAKGGFMRLNINTRVSVVLTDNGMQCLERYNTQYKKSYRIAIGEDRKLTIPLWEAMHIFGPTCIMGFQGPFENGDVEVEQPYC